MNTRHALRHACTLACILAVSGLLAISSASAQTTYYWDGNNDTTGFGTASGTWADPTLGTLTSGWSTSSTGVTAVDGNSVSTTTADSLNFGTDTTDYGLAAGSITVSGTVNAASIKFGNKNGAVVLSGGTINLAAAGTITVGVNTTISSEITGAGTSFTKVGNPVLTLTGLNTYTGKTYIGSSTNGVLEVTHIANGGLASGIGASSSAAANLVLAANNQGVLRYSGTTDASTDRNFTIGNTNYYGGFESSGTGTLTLTSTNAVSYITTNGARYFLLGGTNTGQNILNAQLVNNGTGALTFTKTGAGTWVLANEANSYTGKTSINGGTLSVSKMANYGDDSSIGKGTAGTAIEFTYGTLNYTGSSDSSTDRLIQLTKDGTILNNGTGALNFTATGNFNTQVTTTYAWTLSLGGSNGGTISGGIRNNNTGTVGVTKIGTGTWTLSGANTYSRSTAVNGGILNFANKAAKSSSSAVTAAALGTVGLGVNDSDAAYYSATDVGNLFNTNTLSGFNLNAASGVAIDTTNAGGAFDQTVALTAARSLTKLGTGTLILSQSNTYSGATTVNGGTLLVNGSTAAGMVTVNPTATLGGSGTIGGAVVVNGGGTVAPGASVGTLAAGNATWNDGSFFHFEIADAAGPAGAGWDLLDITGTLDLSALSAGGLTIDVDTLAGAVPGPMANFNPDLGYDWEFVRTSGGVIGFDAAKFLFDVAGFANSYDGTFAVAMQGNSLYIAFRPNPDPDTSTVAASPASVPADGVSTSTITVTLRTGNGTAVPNRQVAVANIAGPGMAVILPATPVTTDAAGVATFTVSSATVGTEVFQATDITDGGGIVIAQTAGVEFTAPPPPPTGTSQTSLIPGYTPPTPPLPDAPQTSLAVTTPPPNSPPAPDAQTAAQNTSEATDPVEDAVPSVIRVTEYYLTTGDFAGTAATLSLDQDLAADYFILVRGSRTGDGLSMPDNDYARVAAVPGGRGGLADAGAANVISLRRAAAEFAWEGVVTVVECLAPDSPAGFRLVDAVVTPLAGAAGSLTCAPWNDVSRVVPFGGYRGGGVELTGGIASRYQGTSAYVRLSPGAGNTLDWERDGGGETLVDAVMTTFVVEWGAGWIVQHAVVAGSAGGDGADAAGEYTTATISPVPRANTWVWGTGIRADAGIGDCAESCLVALGDGVDQNAVESAVAVGSEYSDAYRFDVYALTHPALAVDHRFKPDGDLNGLDIPVAVAPAAPGARFAWLYNGGNGTSSRFPRPRMWSRYTTDDTVAISRGYDGAEFPAWIQGIDFSGLGHGHTD